MTHAKICKCGHIATNHRITFTRNKGVGSTLHHECQFDGCDCTMFVFDRSEHHGNY